jgi:probable rRNA maturation factor
MKLAKSLTICSTCRSFTIPQVLLTSVFSHIQNDYKIPGKAGVALIFCGETIIRNLNKEFRHSNKLTDVLSFNYNEPDLLGEIYICVPRAHKQSQQFGFSLNKEIKRLFVHGMFHLLGYDHKTIQERDRMESKEQKYCQVSR